jgi:hypothetical protein
MGRPPADVIYRATERQAAFHASPETYKLFGGAMGGGKSKAICAEGLALSCDYPGNRGYLCRHTLKAFKKTTLLTLIEILERADIIAKHHQSDNVFYLKGGSSIWYGGLGDDTAAIEKLKSMELGWFGVDEASETTESFFLMLASRLRLKLPGIRYFGLLASNPDPGWLKGRFIDRKLEDHVFIPALPADNPYLPKGYIERLVEIFPEDWQARFLRGDWTAFEGVNNVFPYAAIQEAMSRELPAGRPVELGVDVARFGDDESVIALRKGSAAVIRGIFHKLDTMGLTGNVVAAHRAEKSENTKIDADGLGAGVVDRARELGISITEIHAGGKPENPERFKNRKAEIYWTFRERLLAGDASLQDDLELKAQLTSCTYHLTSAGQIEITSKDDMKKKGLKSPDRAEAIIYAFTPAAEGPTIRRLFGR